jgi:hypothetical protein
MARAKFYCLLLNMMYDIVLSTAAECRIEELEKELLKVHQQMLDHLSDSQVVCTKSSYVTAKRQLWLSGL